MGKSNTFRNDLLKLIFNAVAIANIADNAASAPLTNIFVALHTADPGAAGDQTTNETTYGSYARVAVLRTSGGWTISTNNVSPNTDVTFPTPSSGTGTITHASVGVATSGASKILYSGAIAPTITIATGSPVVLGVGTTITET